MATSALSYMYRMAGNLPRRLVVMDQEGRGAIDDPGRVNPHQMSRYNDLWVDKAYEMINTIAPHHDPRSVLDMYQFVNFFAKHKKYRQNLCHILVRTNSENNFTMGIANHRAFTHPHTNQILNLRVDVGYKPHFVLYNRARMLEVSSYIYTGYDGMIKWIEPYLNFKWDDFELHGPYQKWRDAVSEMYQVDNTDQKQYK